MTDQTVAVRDSRMGRETLPCGHTALDEKAIILNDAAYCITDKRRFKWQPAKWIEIKPHPRKESAAPTT